MDLLRHLRFFVAVAETRHFGHAAASLGMTQPPLSQGVQRLERHLGVRLFDRDARGVRITEAGSALLPRAEELLAAAAVLSDTADAWTEHAVLRVGLALDLEDLVPEVVGALVDRLGPTGTLVRPEVAGSAELIDAVRDGAVDLSVVRHPAVVDGTRPRPVLSLPTRLVAADAASPRPARLAAVPLPVTVPARRHHPAAHDQLVDALRREGHTGATVEEDDLLARQGLVAAGRAVRMTPGGPSDAPASPIPLRIRLVLPVPALRRAGVDHDGTSALIERRLADHA